MKKTVVKSIFVGLLISEGILGGVAISTSEAILGQIMGIIMLIGGPILAVFINELDREALK